ncbi:MAG TPA: TolC family protein [Gemmatimonadales bacterium]|nr:TolC family protein [Gemmatimonadales bacterium]
MIRRTLAILLVVTLGASRLASGVQRQASDARHPTLDTILPVPLTLEAAMQIGRERATTATLARLNARVANARVGERRADLLPSINGGATYGRQTMNLDEFGIAEFTGVTDPFNIWRLTLAGSQTIFDPAALTRVAAARDSAVAAGLDARAAGNLAATSAGVAYLRYAAALETVRAREADSTIAASLYQQSRDLLQAGVSAAIDATRSEVAFAASRTDLELARNQRDRARLDLSRALAMPPTVNIVLPDSIGSIADGIPTDADSAVAYAMAHRAEVAAELARTRSVERSLTAVRRERLPSLGVQGAVQETGPALDRLSNVWHVEVGLKVPLLDGFRRERRIEEQSLRLDAQQIRESDLYRRIATEVRSSLLDLSSAHQQVTLAETRLRLAEDELGQARQRFAAGVAGTVETSNAQASVVAARNGLIQAHAALGTAEVGTLQAVGLLNNEQ